ncbi:MAG: hypothetical protein IIC52_03405 [Proteobacteria bacterium]|nr:hypothetical protein [Pseudomonadota bacterium]
MDPATKFWIEVIAVSCMPITLVGIIWHRIKSEMGMGYRALQFLAIGVVMPIVLILTLEGKLSDGAAAAIIGGVIAYLFTSAAKESK